MDAWEYAKQLDYFGTALISRDGTLVECNGAFSRIVGRDEFTLRNKRIRELTAEEDRQETDERFEFLQAGELGMHMAKRFLKPNGDTVFCVVETLAISDDKLVSVITPAGTSTAANHQLREQIKDLQRLLMAFAENKGVGAITVNHGDQVDATGNSGNVASGQGQAGQFHAPADNTVKYLLVIIAACLVGYVADRLGIVNLHEPPNEVKNGTENANPSETGPPIVSPTGDD